MLEEEFREKYDLWTTYDLPGTDGQLRFMPCLSDHGVIIYIGSDVPIQSDTSEYLQNKYFPIKYDIPFTISLLND